MKLPVVQVEIRPQALIEAPEALELDRAALRRQVKKAVVDALSWEGFRCAEVSVTLAEDAFMRELNHTWRGLRRTTDVLSFPQFEADDLPDPKQCDDRPVLLGDVVVGIASVARRAGLEWFWQDLRRVTVHGVLHLCGWDHVTRAQRRRMRRREAQIAEMGAVGSAR